MLAELGCANQWLLLPSLGDDSVSYARDQGVEALILSGGDDIGSDPLRDQSEYALAGADGRHRCRALRGTRGPYR